MSDGVGTCENVMAWAQHKIYVTGRDMGARLTDTKTSIQVLNEGIRICFNGMRYPP